MGIGRRVSAVVTSPAFFAGIPLLAAITDAYAAAEKLSIGWVFGDLVPRLGLALIVAVPAYVLAAWLRGLFRKCDGASDAAQTARSQFAVSRTPSWLK
jgi:hypothetical protein